MWIQALVKLKIYHRDFFVQSAGTVEDTDRFSVEG